MRAMFMAGEAIGSDDEVIPRRVWCEHLVGGSNGKMAGNSWVGNVFVEDQAALDAIAADGQTAFVIPITIDGEAMSFTDEAVSPDMFGRITAWIAQSLLLDLPPNERRPAHIARSIMEVAAGVAGVDPLHGYHCR